MSEPSNEATNYPVRATISACEVITWIAFRRALPWDGLSALFRASHNRWGTCPPEKVLEALEARAGLAHGGPFHRVWIPDRARSRDQIPDRDRILTPEGPAILRSIRARLRRDTGRLLKYAELAVMLRDDIEADARLSSSVKAARDELRDRAAGGLITVHGIPTTGAGLSAKPALPEAVPASLFMHPSVMITELNTIQSDTARPIEEWMFQSLPGYERVQFRTADVLALWPAPAAGALLREERAAATMSDPVVTLSDLPAAWTVMECIAGIMIRDPVVVHNCDLQRSAAIGPQAHRGTPREAESRVRLELQRSWKLLKNPTSVSCSANTACDELLNALTRGEISASGVRPDGIRVAMDPADWRGLVLRDGRDGVIDAEPINRTLSHVWREVSINKVDIITRWPPDAGDRPGCTEAEPQSTSAAETTGRSKTRYTEGLLRAEYRVRVARWQQAGAGMVPPSSAEDHLWALSRFEHAPRVALRKARQDLAPESWKKPGKRAGMKWRD